MYAALTLTLLIAQPAPKEKEAPKEREVKLDPFIAKAVEADPKDAPIRKLQKERCYQRAVAVAYVKECIAFGQWTPSYFQDYIKLQVTLAENLAELMDKPADKVKCYEMRVDATKEFEKFINTRVTTGNDPPQNLNLAKAARIDAEIELLKLKAEIEKAGKR
jgi:hypothetical protein